MKRFLIISTGGLCLVAVLSAQTFADGDADKKDKTEAVLDGFVKFLAGDSQIDAAVRDKVLAVVKKHRQSKQTRDFALTDGLRELSTDFKKALALLGDEDFDAAIALLKPFAESKNPYLAAESRYYLARALMLQEKYEPALPHLEKLDGDLAAKTMRTGEALFLKGMAQLHLLKRKQAAADLARFLKEHPEAPQRLRVAAWRQLEVMRSIQRGSLPDIHQHMEFSRRKLALKDSGEKTQDVQKRIVAMLDKMIKQAEKKGGT